MIKAGIGLGQNVQKPHEAAKEATEHAISQLDGATPSLIIAYASIQYPQDQVVAGIKSVASDVPLVGGSAAGEITSWHTVFDGISVMALASDQFDITIGVGGDISKNSFQAAADAATMLKEKNGGTTPNLVLTIFDGMTGNGAELVEGVKSVLGTNIPLIGGSTGDDYKFEKTYEYYNDQVLTDSAVCVGLTGKFSYGFGIRHGWEPVGLPMKVTKTDGVLLQEVDGKPALSIYESYFGKESAELVKEPLARMAYTYPIGLEVEGSNELLIRDPVIANEKGEITMASAIPEGTIIRLMIGDRDRAIAAAHDAAENAKAQLNGSEPKAIIMFNCMARNRLLGIRCNEENEKVNETIGKKVPMIGNYTYGEHGPLLGKKDSPAYFHNETMTLLVLGE